METLGAQTYDVVRAQSTLETSNDYISYVKCVVDGIFSANADRIISKSRTVMLIRNEQIAGFVLPGNRLGLYSGALRVTKTSAQLAALIGHELGHLISRHGNERLFENMKAAGGLGSTSRALKDPPKRNIIFKSFGLNPEHGTAIPYSHNQELEADEIGLELMSRAGYDPREAVTFWQNMSLAGGGEPPLWSSVHLTHEATIRAVKTKALEALPIFQSAVAAGRHPKCSLTPKKFDQDL